MFYDLNVPWTSNEAELRQRISFLAELGYNVLALSHLLPAKLPSNITSPITLPLPFTPPSKVKLLARCTLPLTSTASSPSNQQLLDLRRHYSILAVRPHDEKSITQACTTLDIDIISLDLSTRYFFHFRPNIFSAALARGIKLELCYGQGVLVGDDKKRNVIQNATAIIRSTRGRGIIISGEAAGALGCRGPHDVVNLAVVWGMKLDLAREAVGESARKVVAAAQLRTRSYRTTVDVVDGGTRPNPPPKNVKRKADTALEKGELPLSKSAMKKRAKKPGQDAETDGSADKSIVGDSEAGAEMSTDVI